VVKSMAAVRLVRRRRASEPGVPATPSLRFPEIVAIGASTGGPQAIRTIVANLPSDFGLPIVIVQHTTRGYAHTLVDWLRAETTLPVGIAEHGQPLNRPGIVIAPSDRHLVVEGRRLELDDAPPSSLHKPSATVLFRSVARAFGRSAVGVLLTGMGDDGADGLMEMHRTGALTIAQDEASCVVFGMPAQAIRLGAADHVLPPERIADKLLEQLPGKGAAA
jgi:two-component system chemotaxis response regulator CheB